MNAAEYFDNVEDKDTDDDDKIDNLVHDDGDEYIIQ